MSDVERRLRLADWFGDQGLVAVGIMKRDGSRALIDTMLMSCPVMNRHVEQATMSYVVEHVQSWDCEELVGESRPTRKNAVVGVEGEWLKIKVAAPPVDGKANKALVEVLSEWLGIPKSRIHIRSGATSNRKIVCVTSYSAAQLMQHLAQPD